MASDDSQCPFKKEKDDSSCSSCSCYDCDETQWRLPNNLELNSRHNPSKKQRNNETAKTFPPENLVGFPRGANSSKMKYNAAWIKAQVDVCDERLRNRTSEVVFPANDSFSLQSSMNFPANFIEHTEKGARSSSHCSIAENLNSKFMKDECNKNAASRSDYVDGNVEEKTNKSNCILDIQPELNSQKSQELKLQKKISTHSKKNSGFKVKCQGAMNAGTEVSCSQNSEMCEESCNQPAGRSEPSHSTENYEGQADYLAAELLTDPVQLRRTKEFLLQVESYRRKVMRQENSDEKNMVPRNDQSDGNIEEQTTRKSNHLVEKHFEIYNDNADGNFEERAKKSNRFVEKKLSEAGSNLEDIINTGQQMVDSFEFEREKLKNKLLELVEKEKMNDDMALQDIAFHLDYKNSDRETRVEEKPVFNPLTHRTSQRAEAREGKQRQKSEKEDKLKQINEAVYHLQNVIKKISPDDCVRDEQPTEVPKEPHLYPFDLRQKSEKDDKLKQINEAVYHLQNVIKKMSPDDCVAEEQPTEVPKEPHLHPFDPRASHASSPSNSHAGPSNSRAGPSNSHAAISAVTHHDPSRSHAGPPEISHTDPSVRTRVVPAVVRADPPPKTQAVSAILRTDPAARTRGPSYIRTDPISRIRTNDRSSRTRSTDSSLKARGADHSPKARVAGSLPRSCAVDLSSRAHAADHSQRAHAADTSLRSRTAEPFLRTRAADSSPRSRRVDPPTRTLTDDPNSRTCAADSASNRAGVFSNARTGPSTKRDNVRKEINSAFPARRHYEAEGRANEDPVAPVPGSPRYSNRPKKILLNAEAAKKLKRLQRCIDDVNTLSHIIQKYSECKKKGMKYPIDQIEEYIEKVKCFVYDESDESESEYGPIFVNEHLEELPTNDEDEVEEDSESDSFTENPDGLNEDFVCTLKQAKIIIQQQLQEIEHFTKVESKHSGNRVRSSGEGSYTVKINIGARNSPSDAVEFTPLLQNIRGAENSQLTHQNIANIESHTIAFDRNLHKEEPRSNIKDNNLSDKVGRLGLQTATRSSLSEHPDYQRENLDSFSVSSYELNHNHWNEMAQKKLSLVRRDKKDEKLYEGNRHFRIHTNSSINSEPLEDTNSALATDTGNAATWDGPSTQYRYAKHTDPGIPATWDGSSSQYLFDVNEDTTEPTRNRPSNQRSHRESRPKVIANTGARDEHNSLHNNGLRQTLREPPRQESHISPNFIQQLKRQVDQLTELCQSPLSHVFSAHEDPANYQGSSPNFLNPCPSVQPMPVPYNPYNQQLLLCLIQCYHTMYLQQLEIQQLQHILQHSFGAEMYHQANNMSTQGTNESAGIRPCNLAVWPMNATAFPPPTAFPPATAFPPSTGYPSTTAFPPPSVFPPISACPPPLSPTSLFPQYENEHLKYFPPLRPEFGTGIPTIRYGTLRQPEDPKSSEETLNNQVPPRTTRANNFLDNFRSYSRLNLLSASTNVKRNETSVAPQVQPVHPSVLNESSHYNQEDNTYESVEEHERPTHESESPLLNADTQSFKIRSKKANSNSTTSASANYRASEKKSFYSNINSDARNILPDRNPVQNRETSSGVAPVTHSSSVNLIQLHSSQEESKLGNFSPIIPTSTSDSITTSTLAEAPTSDFLANLFREAKSLPNDTHRQKALKFIRDMVLIDKNESDLPSQSKVRNDCVSSSNAEQTLEGAYGPPVDNVQNDNYSLSDVANSEVVTSQSSNDNVVSWTNQNLPTAAVSPLNKPTSTGAVRKRPKAVGNYFGELHNMQSSSHEPVTRENISDELNVNRANDGENPNNIISMVILELRRLIQHLYSSSRDEICPARFWASLNSFVLTKIQNNGSSYKIPMKLMSAVYQALDQYTVAFCGLKLSECEAKYLDFVSQLLTESITSSVSVPDSLPICITPPLITEEELVRWQCREMSMAEIEDFDFSAEGFVSPVEGRVSPTQIQSFQPFFSQNISIEGSDKEVNELQPSCSTSNTEGTRNVCGPEVETEPEVETGTEADLAEADQSPGQQGNVATNSFPGVMFNVDLNWPLHSTSLASTSSVTLVNGTGLENASEVSHGAYFCSEASNDPNICLDDIPTKLCSNSEKEMEQKEEDLPDCVSSSDDHKDEVSSTTYTCGPD